MSELSNQFESLPSESQESSLAQVSFAETVEDNDAPLDPQTPEEKYQERLAGCPLTRRSGAMLRAIHAEVAAQLAAQRKREEFQLADGRVV